MNKEFLLRDAIDEGNYPKVCDILWSDIYTPEKLYALILEFFENVELSKDIWSFLKTAPIDLNTTFDYDFTCRSWPVIEYTFLIQAIKKNQFEIFNLLLQVPLLDVNQMVHTEVSKSGFTLPSSYDETLMVRSEPANALLCAIYSQQPRFVKALLEIEDLNVNGPTHEYALSVGGILQNSRGNLETKLQIWNLLLQRKDLDVNFRHPSHGWGILYCACQFKNIALIKLLFQRDDIDVNLGCAGGDFVPLHQAVRQGKKEVVKTLLTHGNIDLSIKERGGHGYSLFDMIPIIEDKEIQLMLVCHLLNKINKLQN